jgi:hypothetical protein
VGLLLGSLVAALGGLCRFVFYGLARLVGAVMAEADKDEGRHGRWS